MTLDQAKRDGSRAHFDNYFYMHSPQGDTYKLVQYRNHGPRSEPVVSYMSPHHGCELCISWN